MDWENLRHFLAVAQTGTLLGAARQIGVEHATVSRRVAALETSLGLKLVDRRGGRIRLTVHGEEVAREGASMLEKTATITQIGRAGAGSMRGHVKISAPPALSSALLAEPFVKLRRRYPELALTLLGETRLASLNQREADVAIRLSRPESGDYSIVKLGTLTFRFYATDTYLKTLSADKWTFIGYDDSMNASPQEVHLANYAAGRQIASRSSVLEVQASAARLGGGVAILPDFVITKNDCLHIIEDSPAIVREIWLVVHSEIKETATIRAVVDALKQTFSTRQSVER